MSCVVCSKHAYLPRPPRFRQCQSNTESLDRTLEKGFCYIRLQLNINSRFVFQQENHTIDHHLNTKNKQDMRSRFIRPEKELIIHFLLHQ
uniref:Uncharacterized protein n=1 Tax=Anguilla anguilla TaxID=7936 RepID=A0A0E9T7A4_ANGAN